MTSTTEIAKPLPKGTDARRRTLRGLRGLMGSGADMVFLIFGTVVVAVFIVLALVPGLVAPYDPLEEAGPRLLPPGSSAPGYAIAVVDRSPLRSAEDLPAELHIGILAGAVAVNDLQQLFAAQVDDATRIDAERYPTLDELAAAADSGAVDAVVAPSGGARDEADQLEAKRFRVVTELKTRYSGTYLFGTDQVGRDVFSRVVWGTRLALIIGLVAPAVSALVGLLIGIASAYAGGPVDRLAAGIMDALYSMPATIVAIALAAAIGPGLFNLILALSVVYVPTFYRLARSRALSVKQELFIDATAALGAGPMRIVGRHVLPHSVVSVGVFGSVAVAQAIRTAATLSFLGLGFASNDVVEWGSDIARGRLNLQEAWWLLGGPGLALTLLVFGLTLMSDALFERLNPRSRGSAE